MTDVLQMICCCFHHPSHILLQYQPLSGVPQVELRVEKSGRRRRRRPAQSTDEDECCCLDCVELVINRQPWRYGSCLLKMLSLAAQGRTFAMTVTLLALIELQGVYEEDTLPANGEKVGQRFYQLVDGCLKHLIIYSLTLAHNRIHKI